MHNEERERRDNRPNSARQVAASGAHSAQIGGRSIDPRLVSPRAAQAGMMQSRTAAPAVAVAAKKKPVHLNRDDALRLQLNLGDADEVAIKLVQHDLNCHL